MVAPIVNVCMYVNEVFWYCTFTVKLFVSKYRLFRKDTV